jgi:outer membrane protein assembly factor BamB
MVGRRTPERYRFGAALAALVLAACSSTAANPTAPAGGPSFGGLVLPASGGWLTYHRDLARSGLDAASPSFRTPHEAWRVTLDGAVYAEPLISGDRVLVATENDSVYALDATSGRTQWYRQVEIIGYFYHTCWWVFECDSGVWMTVAYDGHYYSGSW